MTEPESTSWLSDKFLSLAMLGAEWVLWILIGLSIAGLAIVIERALFYRSVAGVDAGLVKPVNAALGKGDLSAARKLIRGKSSPGARMLVAMLEVADAGTASVSAMLTGTRNAEKIRLERFINFLGTIGSNAPFIGLFGTVLEILRVFNALGASGVTSGQEAAGIMTGISEALVATAVGLMVAIPAVISYNGYQRKIKRLMSQADALTSMAPAQLADEKNNGKKKAEADE